MTQRLIISAYNYSSVFGGQERFIETFFLQLNKYGISHSLTGGPDRLVKCDDSPPIHERCTISVDMLNGNRALYLRGWRRSDADIRVYVQHSDVQDAQDHPVKQWVRKVLLRLLLRRMDVVIRVCESALPDKYAPGKICTIYNGVSLPVLPPSPPEARPFTLLMVGAVNENKNQQLALQLLEQSSDLHLLVVGDGPDRPALEQWANDLGVGSRVRWLGFVDDPSPYYRQADALLMLSAFEAFPFAILEAMSYALPVVSTSVGGVPEAITDEQDGLLLPARDLPSLSASVRRLRDNPQWREKVGQSARQTVSTRFTVTEMTDNLLGVINVAARKKGLIE